MDLSIIILNHNGKQWLKDCFQSIFNNTHNISFEAILVDNASTDGSVEYTRQKFPLVKVIISKINVGFTRGNNIGIKEATGEYLCILNNDTIVLPGALNNLFHFVKSQPKRTIATGRILRFNGEIQPNCSNPPTFLQEYFNFTISKIKGSNPFALRFKKESIQKVGVVTGTFFVIKRKDMLELDGFDENIFIFYEDADLCLRFRKLGGQVLYYPYSVIKHYWGGYYKSFSLEAIRISYRSILYYFNKHYGRLYRFLFNVAVKMTSLIITVVLGSIIVFTFGCFKKVIEKNRLFLAVLKA